MPCGHFAEGESDSQVGGFASWEHGSVANADETEWKKPFGGFGQRPSSRAAAPPAQASEQPRSGYEASGGGTQALNP